MNAIGAGSVRGSSRADRFALGLRLDRSGGRQDSFGGNEMGAISDDAIRKRAYQIWEREGRPHGHDFEHWVRAQVELIAESSNNSSRKVAAVGLSPAPAKATRPRSNTKSAAKPSRPRAAGAGRPLRPA